MSCRICLEETGPFIHPCDCKGSAGFVHQKCLNRWIEESSLDHCEICKREYQKQEVCTYNHKRCWKHWCSYKITHGEEIRKYTLGLSLLACVSLIFVQIEQLALASCISTLLSAIGLVFYSMKYHKDAGNAAFLWKLAFTGPYTISILIFYFSNEDNCTYSCITIHSACDSTCPLFSAYQRRNDFLLNIWLYDIAILCTIAVLRTVLTACLHCKTIQFKNITEEERSLLKTEP
jgi:hypothetical protein